MNTKEAVARYGLWATHAGFQVWRRQMHDLSGPLEVVAKGTMEAHHDCLNGASWDGPYDRGAVRAIATRAKLRQPYDP